jgi:hypothetical protein
MNKASYLDSWKAELGYVAESLAMDANALLNIDDFATKNAKLGRMTNEVCRWLSRVAETNYTNYSNSAQVLPKRLLTIQSTATTGIHKQAVKRKTATGRVTDCYAQI